MVAAIAPVAAAMTPEMAADFHPRFPVSALIISGDADPIMPFDGGEVRVSGGPSRGTVASARETVAAYVAHNLNRGEPEISLLDADPTDGMRVEIKKYPDGIGGAKTWFYQIIGGGHTWPGRPRYLPADIIGRASQDFFASEAIWQFFKSCPNREASARR